MSMSPIDLENRNRRSRGCSRCGNSSTELLVEIAARELSGSKNPNKRFKRSVSRSHSFCKQCADDVWDEVLPVLERRTLEGLGKR